MNSLLGKLFGLFHRCQHCGGKATRQVVLTDEATTNTAQRYLCENCLPEFLPSVQTGVYLSSRKEFRVWYNSNPALDH